MKGVVFNIVQEVVEEHLGQEMWDDAVDRSDVDGAYTSLGNYPDADLEQLVGSLGELSQLSRSDVLVFAGRHGFQQLAGRHPDLVAPYSAWREVVEHLDDIIHPEVAKIYPGTDTPSFTIIAQPDGSVHGVRVTAAVVLARRRPRTRVGRLVPLHARGVARRMCTDG